MAPFTFRIAMRNHLRLGPYHQPQLTDRTAEEWLIVERFGERGEYLFISDTRSEVTQEIDGGKRPPEGLVEKNTFVAVLAEPASDLGQPDRFLIVRHLPAGLRPIGLFFPSDGCAEIVGQLGAVALHAYGRFAHTATSRDGATFLQDIPNPSESTLGAINWHFHAQERAWPPKTLQP